MSDEEKQIIATVVGNDEERFKKLSARMLEAKQERALEEALNSQIEPTPTTSNPMIGPRSERLTRIKQMISKDTE